LKTKPKKKGKVMMKKKIRDQEEREGANQKKGKGGREEKRCEFSRENEGSRAEAPAHSKKRPK